MDEGGTLDFNDLMDTGDDFPGFEIAKFEPATGGAESDDGILRTPEHEKDDEDYIRRETTISADVLSSGDCQDDGESGGQHIVQNEMETEDGQAISPNNNEDNREELNPSSPTGEQEPEMDDSAHGNERDMDSFQENAGEAVGESSGQGDTRGPVGSEEKSNQSSGDLDDKEDEEERDGEPAAKKKKMYMYLKPPKTKMKLWSTKDRTHEEPILENTSDNSDRDDQDEDRDGGEENDRKKESDKEKEESDREKEESESESNKEEESPQQQSFLSFLNLKPGQSKPQEVADLKKEESLQEEFFSRKRLRTRKKVSYCEDVAEDNDESYEEEEDEESDDDHRIDLTSPRSNRSRRNSRSSGKTSAVTNYAKALQNLLPGVDLSCLQQAKSKTSPSGNTMQYIPIPSVNSNAGLKGLFECGLCGKFFQTAGQFLTHQETVHSGLTKNGRSGMETFRCEICGFVLTNRFAYLEHKKMKHSKSGGLNLNCSKCKMSRFPDLAALQKHQQICGTPFCSTCGATFKAWIDVAEHRKKMHTSKVPTRQWLTCMSPVCNFKCITQHEMKQHMQVKHIDQFACNAPKCSQVFHTREQLMEHKKDVHAAEFIVQYQCMECKNCFSSKTLLAEHQYLHTLEKLRKCDLCLRTFGCISELRKHKDVHTVKGTVRCQECLRWCADKIELVNHVCAQRRRTGGIRLYFCDVCHKDFRSDEKMFAHRKDHKNFFQCALCFLEFSSESEYFNHRQVHGKYTCKECCEELEQSEMEMHEKAHKYYVKMEDIENNGKNEKVMFLCPNLCNAIKV